MLIPILSLALTMTVCPPPADSIVTIWGDGTADVMIGNTLWTDYPVNCLPGYIANQEPCPEDLWGKTCMGEMFVPSDGATDTTDYTPRMHTCVPGETYSINDAVHCTPVPKVQEDDSNWNCATMGNMICADNNPAYWPIRR